MDQLNGKDFMFACSETFLRLQYEVCVFSLYASDNLKWAFLQVA